MNQKHNALVSLMALVLLAVILVCTGCNGTKTAYADIDDAPEMMTIVDETMGYTIYRHDETGVHYLSRDGSYGRGICVMVNADGTPYTGAED